VRGWAGRQCVSGKVLGFRRSFSLILSFSRANTDNLIVSYLTSVSNGSFKIPPMNQRLNSVNLKFTFYNFWSEILSIKVLQ